MAKKIKKERNCEITPVTFDHQNLISASLSLSELLDILDTD